MSGMKLSVDKNRFKIFLKIGALYLAIWLFTDLMRYPDTFFKRAWNNVWLISYLVFLNYFLLEVVLPFFKLRWKRLLLAPFILFAIMMLYSYGFYGWRALGAALNLYFPLITYASTSADLEHHTAYSFASILFFTVVRHVYDYRTLRTTAQQLRLEKQQAELNYLKSQTNPHFLFNTLNNIYSLARDKSDLAAESILRLSSILRFMLYETTGPYIAVEHELKIIDHYIALERLRYDESLRVNFNHDVEDLRQSIPPLLLMPLVENAFKHGASETRNEPFVEIHLSVKKRVLLFVVRNSTDGYDEKQPVKENIGLSNLRRQLQLLFTDYDLLIQPADGTFTASLRINLASHV
jgi:two-component system, LytTR family, sensor kinase